jgi:hypothetical protein
LVENPFLKPAGALVINSNSSKNLLIYYLKPQKTFLLIHEFSVTPLFELGSDFEPLFLKIGNNIPFPQLSGIIPLSNIILNNNT